jgi:surface polysaccharide O-acyltransferase-like enzyme
MILYTDAVCGAIDNNLADLIYTIITIIKFGVPILLIIFGMLDFGKGVMAKKEDEIKAGQNMFFKRVISAILVFFVVTVVQLVVNFVDDKNGSSESSAWRCANAIMNGRYRK